MRVSAPQPLTRPCGGVRHRAPDVGGERAIGAFKAAWARGPFPGSAGFCCLTSPEPYALSNLVISTWHRVDTERSAVPGPGPPGSGPLLALEQQQEFWPVFPAQSLMPHSKLAGGRAGSPHLDLRARLCFLLPRVSLCDPGQGRREDARSENVALAPLRCCLLPTLCPGEGCSRPFWLSPVPGDPGSKPRG